MRGRQNRDGGNMIEAINTIPSASAFLFPLAIREASSVDGNRGRWWQSFTCTGRKDRCALHAVFFIRTIL